MTFKRESTDSSDDSTSRVNGPDEFYLKSFKAPTSETTCLENQESTYCLKTKAKKGRVKISSKRTFLDETSSSQEEDFTEEPVRWTIVNTFEVSPAACNEAHVEVKIEDDTQEATDIATWRQPLTSDDFSNSSDEEIESTSSMSYQTHRSSSKESQSLPKGASSMILKLRKVFFNEGHRGRVTHYQKVTETIEGSLRGYDRFRSIDRDRYKKKKPKSSKLKRRHTDREFSVRLQRSYSEDRSYLSKQHLSKRRRRWVLRSAVQSARLAMENTYPDLVGKRIRHLYEEKDKTEVWYRGVVLRIHEPHRNPLKTVFEVKYDSEPEWQYFLELLLDYKKGWLKVED